MKKRELEVLVFQLQADVAALQRVLTSGPPPPPVRMVTIGPVPTEVSTLIDKHNADHGWPKVGRSQSRPAPVYDLDFIFARPERW